MERIELRAFSGKDGSPIKRLPFLTLSWSDSLNEAGSLTATLPGRVDARSVCRRYGTILAAVSGKRVLHAGYVTHVRFGRQAGEWSVDCGGGLSILKKRLVLNHALDSSWTDGLVVVDEENPSGDWPLHLEGSYSDLVRGLIAETMRFGTLPIRLAEPTGGGHERNYNSYDLATVYDRIHDICELEDGPEVRLDPVIGDDDRLVFVQRTAEEIVDHHWRWNVGMPGCPVSELDTDIDSDAICTESYGTGGKEEDSLLVARARSSRLIDEGYPVLQMANTEHSSVSELPTLQSYVASDVAAGISDAVYKSYEADPSLDIRCGDWADIRTPDGVERMKITDVSGSVENGRIAFQATERI